MEKVLGDKPYEGSLYIETSHFLTPMQQNYPFSELTDTENSRKGTSLLFLRKLEWTVAESYNTSKYTIQ